MEPADLHHIATVATAAYLGRHPADGLVEHDGVVYYIWAPYGGDTWRLHRRPSDALVARFEVTFAAGGFTVTNVVAA